MCIWRTSRACSCSRCPPLLLLLVCVCVCSIVYARSWIFAARCSMLDAHSCCVLGAGCSMLNAQCSVRGAAHSCCTLDEAECNMLHLWVYDIDTGIYDIDTDNTASVRDGAGELSQAEDRAPRPASRRDGSLRRKPPRLLAEQGGADGGAVPCAARQLRHGPRESAQRVCARGRASMMR
eukprot:981550-Rhodomonas_salina.4